MQNASLKRVILCDCKACEQKKYKWHNAKKKCKRKWQIILAFDLISRSKALLKVYALTFDKVFRPDNFNSKNGHDTTYRHYDNIYYREYLRTILLRQWQCIINHNVIQTAIMAQTKYNKSAMANMNPRHSIYSIYVCSRCIQCVSFAYIITM